MAITVGTDTYISLSDSYTYMQSHGYTSWTAYRKTIISIATHTDGIVIETSAVHGYSVGSRVSLYDTTNYNDVGNVKTIVDTTHFTLDLTFVINESSGYAVNENIEVYLRKATEWIDNHPNHKGNWKGSLYVSTQVLSFPRSGIVDEEGRDIADSTIPSLIEYACCEMAYKCLSEVIFPDVSSDKQGLKRDKIDVIEKEWFYYSSSNLRKKYDYVNNLLSGLLKSNGSYIRMVRSY